MIKKDALNKKKRFAALFSVLSNTTLVVSKCIIGIAIGSVSVISEAIHSAVDLLASIIAYFAVVSSSKPADKTHKFGHGKVENISGTVEALLIFVAALWILFEAYKKLLHRESMGEPILGIIVMLISVIANYCISRYLFKVGKEADSIALLADAWHLRTDVWTSVGVTAGLVVILIGEKIFHLSNLYWIDPAMAIFVALLIMKAAYKLTIEAGRDLLDASLPEEEEIWICNHLDSLVPKIKSYHNFKTRKAGSERFIEFHLLVDKSLSVKQSHQITEEISIDIKSKFPNTNITIHVEPHEEETTEATIVKSTTIEVEKKMPV